LSARLFENNGCDKMKAVVQRVLESSVQVEDQTVGKIGAGFTVLLGITKGDSDKEAELLAGKIARLRVFCDTDEKMNLSLTEIGGSALVVSQFTLCADIKKGNRPSFIESAEPEEARRLYEFFIKKLKENGVPDVQTGVFAAKMRLTIVNDGPVTIVLDTDIWKKKIN
jgi:D-aminoacyl-tRNA deacylase